jgi:hypothetical protein
VANGTREDLARTVESLLSNPKAYEHAAAANSRWLAERHDPAGRVDELAAAVRRTLAAHPRRTIARAH